MIRHRRLRDHSINRLIPNMLTIFALCAGLTGIRFALLDRWENAVIAILIAAVFDALDGRIARLLDSSSKFGAELDSLSDFVSFGVAPAMIMFLWSTHEVKGIGWALTLAFSACMALRLARFNTKLDNADLPAWTSRFFTGVPAPAGAGLVLMPLIAWLEYGFEFLRAPLFVGIFLVVVAGLLVSRLPTFSFKRVRVTQAWVLPTMIAVVAYASLLVSLPWATLFFTLLAYLSTLPFAYRSQRRLQAQRPIPEAAATEVDADHD
ncbi:CDP-diacylglycerol--serine O-phosphatidyltransferase [Dongia rigui]|uniref:CDP-diacylglycerol--serine O-phosphatidyltransferase n=1 Tax=Dongia rigui TaxID=940149 RepID=A0ABU5DU01_9PROT|nr:CDP-diacylglycerol--serine O-phosphatidyltransferase [Dongia rigui]MDY0870472.1 CDP-diacylglycerol--serine O-phosphatidyltransferase [Dongia rigui]